MGSLFNKNIKIFEAVAKNDIETLRSIISKGADVNARDKNGKTPLSFAINNGYIKIAELLRQHGATE